MADNITYKTADQLPLMEEVTETTHAIVEDNGQLKRVPGSMLGGDSSKVARIFVDLETFNPTILSDLEDDTAPTALNLSAIRNGGVSVASISDDETSALGYCENMTCAEAREALMSGKGLRISMYTKIPKGKRCDPIELGSTDMEVAIDGSNLAATCIAFGEYIWFYTYDPMFHSVWYWYWSEDKIEGLIDR